MNPEETTRPETDEEQLEEDTKLARRKLAESDSAESDTEMTVMMDDDDDGEDTEPTSEGTTVPAGGFLAEGLGLESAEGGSGGTPSDATELLEDDGLAGEAIGVESLGGTIGGESASGAGGEDDGDDVFVILPEQVEGDAPSSQTDVINADMEVTQNIEDVPLISEIGGAPGAEVTDSIDDDADATDTLTAEEAGFDEDDGIDPTEIVADDDLDHLAAGIDEDDVWGGDPGTEFPADEFGGGFDDTLEGRPRSRLVQWILPLAAALLVGLGGFYFLSPDFASRVNSLLGRSTPDQPPVATPTTGTTPSTGVDTGASGEDTAGQAFRRQVELALRMGFMGEEAADE